MADDRLTYALSVLAGDPCIQIGPAMQLACRSITVTEICAAESERERSAGASLSTWLCAEALFFTLIKADGQTLVFSHANRVLYHATPQAQLTAACPAGAGILCQFTVDTLPGECAARLLAFDILHSPEVDPTARGESLRALEACLPSPLCLAQWVGPLRYLTAPFVVGLPHPVAGVITLTPDPLLVCAGPLFAA